jgi:hypothetical protein
MYDNFDWIEFTSKIVLDRKANRFSLIENTFDDFRNQRLVLFKTWIQTHSMGNQQPIKHSRSDSIKNTPSSATPARNHNTTGTYIPSSGSNYPNDDFEEIAPSSLNTKNYSPTESVPIFKFPLRADSIQISSASTPHVPEIKKIPVVFKYPSRNCKDVFLVGVFTNWKEKINMVRSDGDYIVIVDLPEGEHQYKFVVDGKWEHDPSQVLILMHIVLCLRRHLLFHLSCSHVWMIHSAGKTI